MLDDKLLFTVTDIKQYSYCPRVIFYEQCLPHIRPRTYKMDAGRTAHEEEPARAIRRTLTQYHVAEGERHFDVAITSSQLHLTGIIDEVVFLKNGGAIPVDYKLAKKVGHNHRIQLTAYALLLEEQHHCVIHHGFIYLIPLKRAVEVSITQQLRDEVENILKDMLSMVLRETHPAVKVKPNQCVSCEFRRFCNDQIS